MKKRPEQIFLCSCLLVLSIHTVSAIDFVFNGFNSSDVSLFGTAQIESRILALTNDTANSIGRGLYPSKIPTKQPNSSIVLPFACSFLFSMAPYKGRLPGHGIVFLFVPREGIEGATSAQHLGFLNFTNQVPGSHVFGVEFDVFKNEEFNDIDDNHVGIDADSLTSVSARSAGYWPDNYRRREDGRPDKDSFRKLKLNDGKVYQVWIDYAESFLDVTMAPVGMKKPNLPLLSHRIDLSQVFEDEMYMGFTAATGTLVQGHKILAWSFSNSNFSLSEALITRGLPSFELPKVPFHTTKGFIAGTIVGVLFIIFLCGLVSFFYIRRNRRIRRQREEMEDWELEYWPHRLTYQEIELATKSFSDGNVIGVGANGKVYKGKLSSGAEIAVKRISLENSEGIRAFLAEISTLGRLQHRNLVRLRGWCKKEKGSLILVYEYMENGSLDMRVFDCDESKMLNFEERTRILRQVASGVLYLHDEWESKVLHRDIKASNVLLDKGMNARLGDFGLARMHDHDKVAGTTRVVGTIGYLAPETVKCGRTSTQTDVFGFGVLILEVICGRRPIEANKPPLVDWVWELFKREELINAVDARLRATGELNMEEVDRLLHLGLLCAHPDPNARPSMRQIVKFFERDTAVDESDNDDMDIYLLQEMKTKEYLYSYPSIFNSGSGSHPTFDEIRAGFSTSWSSINIQGPSSTESGNGAAKTGTI